MNAKIKILTFLAFLSMLSLDQKAAACTIEVYQGKVKKLSLEKNENYAYEPSMNFKEAKPFKFSGLD